MRRMQTAALAASAAAFVAGSGANAATAGEDAGIRVLIMTGQHNHDWKATTPVMRKIYEAGGKFDVTVNEKPWELKDDAFARFDVVVSNWSMWPNIDQDPWDEPTKAAFLNFMRNGGGLVVVHAGSTIFYKWPEFQKIIGATWAKGVTGHGSRHEFEIKITDPDHPVTKGLESFVVLDELWHKMARQDGVKIHATAMSRKDKGGSGNDEPMVMTTRYGKGRCVNLVPGHDPVAMGFPGFQELLLRSTEWAATGSVKQPCNVSVKPANP